MVDDMLGEEGARNLFSQIMKLWVEPELAQRRETGGLPEGFRISRCLIRLPKDRSPIVEFNREIGWTASVRIAPGTAFEKGQRVFLHEIREITAVNPPAVNGQRVAFVYFFWTGRNSEYEIIFDFTPNVPSEFAAPRDKETWQLSEAIATSLQAILVERTIRIHDYVKTLLQKIGLWAAPALLPYPLSKIVLQLKEGNLEGARETLVDYCTPEYVEGLSSKWWSVEQFEKRRKLIEEALRAHKEEQYHLSIHTLLPQVEGIITDWIYAKLPEAEIPWRQKSKTKRFKDLVLSKPPTTVTYSKIVESTVDFIVGGPVLKTFRRWVDEIDQAFPNRHVIQHGRYDDSLFNEENSVKLLLILDSIYYIISS